MSCCFEQIKAVSLKFVTMPLFLMKKRPLLSIFKYNSFIFLTWQPLWEVIGNIFFNFVALLRVEYAKIMLDIWKLKGKLGQLKFARDIRRV